jgi:hypothetical protein
VAAGVGEGLTDRMHLRARGRTAAGKGPGLTQALHQQAEVLLSHDGGIMRAGGGKGDRMFPAQWR